MKIQIILLLAMLLISVLAADTYYVPSDFPTIQMGINNMVNNDILLVSPGIYYENIDFWGKSITVASYFYATQDTSYISQTIIDGSNDGSVAVIDNVEDDSAVLSGFTIQNGSNQNGGGIHCRLSDTELSYLIVKNNQAEGTIEDDFGGGLYFWNSTCSLDHLLVENNSGDKGGGLYSVNTNFEMNEVEYLGNSAQYTGGGAHIHGGVVNISNGSFEDNSAREGGGLYLLCNTSYLEGITFTGNTAIQSGGGICNRSSMEFSDENRCNIYQNNVESRLGGSDFYSQASVTVYADTFTVLYPTSYHASPIENFAFDILHGMLEQVNADLYVSPAGDNTNSGESPDEALQTIQYACSIILADSLNPHTIHLAEGVYSPDTNSEFFPIILPHYVSLKGTGRDETILDAQSQAGVLKFMDSDDISVSSMTLINGMDSSGAGIEGSNSTAELYALAINHCIASNGGGIYLQMGSYILHDIIVSNNTADIGAGINLSSVWTTFFDSLVIENNQAAINGGGIRAVGSEINISNTQIRNNTAQDWGGGLYLYGTSTYNFENVEITGNQVNQHSGGGIYMSIFALANISDVKIAYNSCPESGGGVYLLPDVELIFDPDDRCNIYLNNSWQRDAGSDIYSVVPVEIIVDTFTVMEPTDYHVAPLENFSFDILNCLQQQVAADLYVSPDGDNSHSGISEEEPLKTIQYACSIILADSLDPHTINLLPGSYSNSSNGEYFPISLPDNVSLNGSSQESVILDAENNSAVIRLSNSMNNTISNLKVLNGNSAGGAGIYCNNSNPYIHHIIMQSNSVEDSDGGAILINDGSEALLHDIKVQNNSAYNGGGMSILNASADLQDVIFENNAAANHGGGLISTNSDVILHNATFKGNFALEFGGGIYCDESNLTISNCLFYDNMVLSVGGGICSRNNSLILISNSTFTCNYAHSSSGIHSFLNSSLYAVNCIFWDNTDDVIRFFGGLPTDTFCLVYSDIQGGSAAIIHGSVGLLYYSEGNINQDPLFVSAQDDDFQLQAGSPCIDTGIAQFEFDDVTMIDLDESQYFGTAPDMGYFEYINNDNDPADIPSTLNLTISPNPFNPYTTFNFSLPEASHTKLAIYNIKGQLVQLLIDDILPAGNHTHIWNGSNLQGSNLSSGIYLLTLETETSLSSKKITLLK